MLNPQTFEQSRERRKKREELFIQRYEGLLAWALQLTDQHRASAEDLVQDASRLAERCGGVLKL